MDTDTVSSYGDTDYSDLLRGIPSHAAASHLFWAYQRHKAAWRFIHKKGGTRKGTHAEGKPYRAYLADLSDRQIEELFYLPKGKGGGGGTGNRRSTGKKRGRSGNPRLPDGAQMRCH
jgi:hypothetical protein